MNLSDKTAMVVDNGLMQPLAHRLSKEFGRVLYLRDHKHAFPVPMDSAVGKGYGHITRVDSWEKHVDEVDVFIFPDLYWAETQAYLRSLGKRVFGAGWAEGLELWRDDFYSTLKEAGMNAPKWQMVRGVADLREHLEDEENKYIKVSYHRGLMETFKWVDSFISSTDLDDLAAKLGPLADQQWFLVQDELECKCELGSDQIIVDGRFPKWSQYAIEGKDKTCLAMMRRDTDLPKEVQQINRDISAVIRDFAGDGWNPYRGFFSTEIRVAKDGKPYLTDPTCRMASPCGETYMLMCENIGEMIWAAADGELVEPKFTHRFAAQALIQADAAEEHNVPIEIDPKVRDMVCLYHSGKKENGEEIVLRTDAGLLEIGSVVGLGKSIDAAIENCRENAKKIRGRKLTIAVDGLEEFAKNLLK